MVCSTDDVGTGLKGSPKQENGSNRSGVRRSDKEVGTKRPEQLTLSLSGFLTQGHIRGCLHSVQRGAPGFQQPKRSFR